MFRICNHITIFATIANSKCIIIVFLYMFKNKNNILNNHFSIICSYVCKKNVHVSKNKTKYYITYEMIAKMYFIMTSYDKIIFVYKNFLYTYRL